MEEIELSSARMPIVVVGHVDHGKSTVVGRLLADTHSLPEGKLEQVKFQCHKTSRPFEYAFLLDALKEEQAQGITIDVARIFFSTNKRDYLIIDAPGHVEFLKNMVTGAAHAQAACLVIDAKEGIKENSKRHGYLLSVLGVKNVAVLINKMDLVGYDQKVFEKIVAEYHEFLKPLNIVVKEFIPTSGYRGENLVTRSKAMSWYTGPTLIDVLEDFPLEEVDTLKPLRMPVQDVYKFTRDGDDRRIVAGQVESGVLKTGDEVIFYPSGKTGQVKSLEAFNKTVMTQAAAGSAVGFTLHDQIYVTRGQVAGRKGEPAPQMGTRFVANLFWLGSKPLTPQKEYVLKLGTAKISFRLESIRHVLDSSSLESTSGPTEVKRHQAAECVLHLQKTLCFDVDVEALSRFVIIDGYDIAGGGIIRQALPDVQAEQRQTIFARNEKWESSHVSEEERSHRLGQKPCLVLVTGAQTTARKEFAKNLEKELFNEGHTVFYLGMGGVVYGLDADLRGQKRTETSPIRRLAEIAHMMLSAGLILVVSASELSQDDLQAIQAAAEPYTVLTLWLGEKITTDLQPSLCLPEIAFDRNYPSVKSLMTEKKIFTTAIPSERSGQNSENK